MSRPDFQLSTKIVLIFVNIIYEIKVFNKFLTVLTNLLVSLFW